ncbi:MAG TPA: DNA translocase FtsK 4TM domain-containing protein, partial [Candidatus Limnocylindrales bacterium]|nr:DNA translocase FtsK 4TM domain-containing protein [Candidatus Limnocylindrales bacterium]
MATRRTAGRRIERRRRRGRPSLPRLSPEVVRSLTGIALLVLGVVTLVALVLPGEGTLTDWWRDRVAPWFGAGRWLLPFGLLAAGGWLEWRQPGPGWHVRLLGGLVAFVAGLGIGELVFDEQRGGRIGRALADTLPALLTAPGAVLVLAVFALAGIAIALDQPVGLVAARAGQFGLAVARTGRDFGVRFAAAFQSPAGGESAGPGTSGPSPRPTPRSRVSGAPSAGQTAAWGSEPASLPVSATFATADPPPVPERPAGVATLARSGEPEREPSERPAV